MKTVDIRSQKSLMTKKRSLINQYFSIDTLIEIEKVTMLSDFNNNEKGMLIKEIMKKENIPYQPLGNGTNRMGFLLDGYAVKVALDKDGINNIVPALSNQCCKTHLIAGNSH